MVSDGFNNNLLHHRQHQALGFHTKRVNIYIEMFLFDHIQISIDITR